MDSADKVQTPRAAFSSDFAGRWLGEVEDALGEVGTDEALPLYAFPSGSTQILLEISEAEPMTTELRFGHGEPEAPPPVDVPSASLPTEGFAYSAEPVVNAFDVKRSGSDDDSAQRALDGKLVLAFSPACGADDCFIAHLHLRFAGDILVGVFDGLNLINERGFLTRPGRVDFRRADEAPPP